MTTRASDATQVSQQSFTFERRRDLCADLYQQYSSAVFGYLYKITGSASESEDVLQDTFLKLFHRVESLDPDRNPRAFIFQIAHNLAIDRFRSQQKSKRLEEAIAPRGRLQDGHIHLDGSSPSSGPWKSAEFNERKELVQELMGDLDIDDRSLLLLFSKGLNNTELAEVLGVSRPTAKKRLTAAMSQLQRALAERQIKEEGDL